MFQSLVESEFSVPSYSVMVGSVDVCLDTRVGGLRMVLASFGGK